MQHCNLFMSVAFGQCRHISSRPFKSVAKKCHLVAISLMIKMVTCLMCDESRNNLISADYPLLINYFIHTGGKPRNLQFYWQKYKSQRGKTVTLYTVTSFIVNCNIVVGTSYSRGHSKR